jgi:site-specific DNA-methyltransferase (adenine-specific)
VPVERGDVLDVLASMPDNSADACLSDPPYGLTFMGKRWDVSVPGVDVWAALLRVLKPGAPLLAFGGTRTYHRLAVAIEDAGFEIRDALAWMYGSGFPKSLDVSKAIDAANGDERPVRGRGENWGASKREDGKTGLGDFAGAWDVASAASAAWEGYGTALKPAYEPIVLARKPMDGTVAANVARWGVGGLAIDASRIGYASEEDQAAAAAQRLCRPSDGVGVGEYGHHGANAESSLGPYLAKQALGRWPANVLLDESAAERLDAQSGDRPGMSGGGAHAPGYTGGMFGAIDAPHLARNDHGGASRFFYVAKPTREERELGCASLPMRSAAEMTDSEDGQARLDSPRTGAGRTAGARNHHPTLKPITLTRYLARLIMPPKPGRILVPFCGSGSEMIGAILAGWPDVVGIEREADLVEIARARVALALSNPRAFEPYAERKAERVDERQMSLLGGVK